MNFSSWAQTITLWLLAILFIGAGIAHFSVLSQQFAAIVPKLLPYPVAIVRLTGILEVLGGVGLLIPATTRPAGIGLMLFLVAVFPANIEAARLHFAFSNPLWLRAVAQVVLIGLIAWVSLRPR